MGGLVSMEIQKDVFQVVAMDLRHKVRIVLDEVYQVGGDFAVTFKGH